MKLRSVLSAIAALAVIVLVVAGCGGGDSVKDEEPEDVLSQTFTTNADEQIESGVVDINVNVDAGSTGDFTFKLAGPFSSNLSGDEAEPDFDLDGSLSGTVQGQSVEMTAGVVAAGGETYLTVGDEAYVLPEDSGSDSMPLDLGSLTEDLPEDGDIAEAIRESCRDAAEDQGTDPGVCDDIDPDKWLNLTNEGETELNGEKTVRVTGVFDFPALLANLKEVADKVDEDGSGSISSADIDQVGELITAANFELHTGAEDTLLRQLSATVTIDPTKVPSSSGDLTVTGMPTDPITISLTITISELNEEQTIAAPENAKPIDQLDPNSLGGGMLGSLLGGMGGLGGQTPGGDFSPGEPGEMPPGGDVPQLDPEKLKAYEECVEGADQSDIDQLQECYSLLM